MKVRLATKEEWKQFAEQTSAATFFHTYDWYSLWSEYSGQLFEARIFEFNGQAKALLPLLKAKRLKGLLTVYTSSPVGTYGGYLCQSGISDPECRELADYLKNFRALSLYENPFNHPPSPYINWNKEDFTQVLILDRTLESIRKSWSSNHQRSLKKAQKANLEIVIAEESADWESYFQLYQESVSRWGIRALNNYPWSLFDLLRQLSMEKCRLWLAKDKGQIISGCLCFYWQKHVVYWHGASTAIAFEKSPVHLLHYHIIEHALRHKMKIYDFNPSGGLEGVKQFKSGFGTIVKRQVILEKESRIRSLLLQLHNKLWKK